MAAITDTPFYVTKGELDLRMGFSDKKTEILISSMRDILDERIDKMQAINDRNFARYEALVTDVRSEMRSKISDVKSEISDLRGDIKALSAKVDAMQMKFGWYLTLFGVGVGVVLALFQLLIK